MNRLRPATVHALDVHALSRLNYRIAAWSITGRGSLEVSMRLCYLALIAGLLSFSVGCTIHEGDVNFDGSFFQDDEDSGPSAKPDAGRHDAGHGLDEDSGEPRDAGMDAALPMDSGTEPSDLKPSDAPKALAQGLCAAFNDCLGPALTLDLFNRNPCEDFLAHQQADRDLHFLEASISDGRAAFHAELFANCQKDLKLQGCNVQSSRLPDSCKQAIEGKVALDGACNIDYDCKGNAYCDKGLDGLSCPGTCSSVQTAGLPCLASTECASGLICRKSGASAQSVCTAPLAEGDSCAAASCPVGLTCQGQDSARTCRSIPSVYTGKLNDSCDPFAGKLCQFDLVCESQSKTSGLCKPPSVRNGSCRRATPNQCLTDQYCKSTNSAAQPDPGVIGVCADLPHDTQSCDSTKLCAAGTTCLNSDTTCHTYKALGESCVEAAECYSGACDNGHCDAPRNCSM